MFEKLNQIIFVLLNPRVVQTQLCAQCLTTEMLIKIQSWLFLKRDFVQATKRAFTTNTVHRICVCVCSHSQASVSGSALQSPHGDPQHSFSEEEHHAALQHHYQELQPNTTPKVPCPLGGSWRLFSLFEYVQEITLCIFQADLNVCR